VIQSTLAGPHDELLIIAENDGEEQLLIEQEFLITTDTWVNVKEMR